MHTPSRREFLKSTVTTACSAGLTAWGFGEVLPASPASHSMFTSPPSAPLPIKKGVLLDMLPAKLSYADRMKMARDVGFEVIQAPTMPDQGEAEDGDHGTVGLAQRRRLGQGQDAAAGRQ